MDLSIPLPSLRSSLPALPMDFEGWGSVGKIITQLAGKIPLDIPCIVLALIFGCYIPYHLIITYCITRMIWFDSVSHQQTINTGVFWPYHIVATPSRLASCILLHPTQWTERSVGPCGSMRTRDGCNKILEWNTGIGIAYWKKKCRYNSMQIKNMVRYTEDLGLHIMYIYTIHDRCAHLSELYTLLYKPKKLKIMCISIWNLGSWKLNKYI